MENPLFVGASVGDFSLPAFATDQDSICYDQKLSQICGMYLVPAGATKASIWTSADSWYDVVDNNDITMTKPRYVVGIGSFLPLSKEAVSLSGGRRIEYKDRSYRFDFSLTNMHPGHKEMIRRFENGWRNFNIWIETMGETIIGGQFGLRPFITDGEIPFGGGNSDRERLRMTADFFFQKLP